MRRLVLLLPVLVALQVGVQPALAWTLARRRAGASTFRLG
jgi:hypothetical protein